MEAFTVPTDNNRLLVHEGRVYQVSVSWARGQKSLNLLRDVRAQRELQRAIAVLIKFHGDDSDENSAAIKGDRLVVQMRKHDGTAMREGFDFRRGRERLEVSPWLYWFTVAEVEI